jgi:ribosomal protein S18 acetylase RimI-like enzyme
VRVAYRLVPFGAKTPPPAQDLAQLHVTLLPTSPIASLGNPFMERFYYRILPREGLIFGTVAYVDEQPAGFVAATHDPLGFMKAALRRWWPYLVWVVGTSLLSAPASVGAVWEASQVMMSRSASRDADSGGEILSLGVLPMYREPRFIRQSGLRIAIDLVDSAVAQLLTRGVQVVRATVSADNTLAKLFYSGLGWTLCHTSTSGWQHPTVEFVWRTYDQHVRLLGISPSGS